jgi:hypothetical protein
MTIPQRRLTCLTVIAAVAILGSTGAGQSGVPAAVRWTYGGDGVDAVHAVTTDAAGNIYIAGRTTSKSLPGTERGYQKTPRGFSPYGSPADGFVAKLRPDGRVIWATYLGGNDARMAGKLPSSADGVRAIAVDAQGQVYVAGTTSSTDFPTTPNAFQTHHQSVAAGTYDGFFARFKADGSELLYSTYIGAPDRSTVAEAIAVGRNGDAWVFASTPSSRFPWTHDVSGGTGGAYLAHILAGGSVASWTRVGSGSDSIAGLSLDRLGRPHVLTQSTPLRTNLVLTQLDEGGTRANFRWSPILPTAGSSPQTIAGDLAIAPDGTIVVVGLVTGPLAVTQPFQPEPGGRGDGFLAALNPQGVPEVVSYLGGSGTEPNRPRVAVDADHVHVALDTGSFNLRTERAVLAHHPDSPLYTSADKGSSWNRSGNGLSGGVSDFAFDPGRDIVYTLAEGVVLRSADRGATWHDVRRIEPIGFRGRIAIDPRDPATLYAGEWGLYRLDRSGDAVTQLRQTTAGLGGFRVDSIAVSPHDGSVWIGTGNGVDVSFDRGVTWERRVSGLPTTSVGTVASPVSWAMDPGRSGTMVIGTSSYGLFGTTNHGLSWEELTETLPERHSVEAVALDPSDSRRIYAGTFNRGIFVTDDGGRSWRRTTASNLLIKSITADARPPHDVFAAVIDYVENKSGVLVSRDRGTTWGWSLQTRDALKTIAMGPHALFAAGPTNVAPYIVRFNFRQWPAGSSFASYLTEEPLRGLATSPQGDSVLAFNSDGGQTDVVIVRIAR